MDDDFDDEILTKIAGVSHDNADGSSRQAILRKCKNGESLVLASDPGNKFSKTAVKILRANGQQLGFVGDDKSGDIRILIDNGYRVWGVISKLTGGTEDRPTCGANISIRYEAGDAAASPSTSPEYVFSIFGESSPPSRTLSQKILMFAAIPLSVLLLIFGLFVMGGDGPINNRDRESRTMEIEGIAFACAVAWVTAWATRKKVKP